MKRFLKNLLSLMVCATLVVQVVSCGTLLYPERDGQKSGTLDITVVLLDAAGLLFFLIPGIIAFAVDFHTGAIYLPPGHPRSKDRRLLLGNGENLTIVKVDPQTLNPETIEAIITKQIGRPVRLNDPGVVVKKAKPEIDIFGELQRLSFIASN